MHRACLPSNVALKRLGFRVTQWHPYWKIHPEPQPLYGSGMVAQHGGMEESPRMNDWIETGMQHVWGDRGIGERRDGMECKQAKIKGQGKDGRKAWMWRKEGKDPTVPRNQYKACALTCFGCAVAFAAATGLFVSWRDAQAHLGFGMRLDHPTQTCRSHPPGSVVLYRIIGNEIPGRHGPGQTMRNVPYILDQAEEFQGCTKRFVLNRIVNDTVERELIQLFKERNVQFTRIPFEPRVYRKVLLDTGCLPTPDLLFHPEYHKLPARRKLRLLYAVYRLKNNYVLNNNGARNAALREGKSMAAWTLPWDGNCFLVPDAYQHIYSKMSMSSKVTSPYPWLGSLHWGTRNWPMSPQQISQRKPRLLSTATVK
eukprot:scaffold312_cov409-Pavlova_lutheri.AAC.2